MNKSTFRASMIKKRNNLTDDFVSRCGINAAKLLFSLPEYASAGTVMSYMSYKCEMPSHEIAQSVIDRGRQLLLPYTGPDFVITAYKADNLRELAASPMGILEPDPGRAAAARPEDIDMVVVPGVAFDLSGNRMGFGKGCYDRFLPAVRPDCAIVGLCYEFQLTDCIPAEAHDVPMQIIVTESRIIRV